MRKVVASLSGARDGASKSAASGSRTGQRSNSRANKERQQRLDKHREKGHYKIMEELELPTLTSLQCSTAMRSYLWSPSSAASKGMRMHLRCGL